MNSQKSNDCKINVLCRGGEHGIWPEVVFPYMDVYRENRVLGLLKINHLVGRDRY